MTPGSAIRAVHSRIPGGSCRALRVSACTCIRLCSHSDPNLRLARDEAPSCTAATRALDAGPCGDRDARHRRAHGAGNVAATVTGLTP